MDSSPAECDNCWEKLRKSSRRRARPWHRVLGILLALPLLWVVITGAPLGHTVDWKLDQRLVSHPWVLKAYGMTPAGSPRGLQVGDHLVVEWDGQLFGDGQVIGSGSLVGALKDGGGYAVVLADGVLRLDARGELLETLGSESLPPLPITAAGLHGETPVLRNADGWHRVLDDWLDHEPVGEPGIESCKPAVIRDERLKREMQRAWAGGGLPLSRVILDLHAGRFLGPLAPYFYDLVAVTTAILCVSGLILFFRQPRRERTP